jgi:iron-sulfur cluster assembly accessory protein
MIKLTEDCISQFDEVGGIIRYSLNGGGCSGLIGKWEKGTDFEETDKVFSKSTLHTFIIDKFTAEQLKDATIDYSGDKFGKAFIVSIPGTNKCGCGESFERAQ